MAVRAPEIAGEWVNSPPLAARDLRGRVVLADFWDYSCVNCLRTLPYLREWDRRYRDRGLQVIGIHAPEFVFGRRAENVLRAMEELGIAYPVVLDNDFRTWDAFANRAWPAGHLIDQAGYVRYRHTGEGRYRETEAAIQELLREIDPAVGLPPLMDPVRAADLDAVGQTCPRPSPELYLGYRRGRIANLEGFVPDRRAAYDYGGGPLPDMPALAGEWIATEEYLETAGAPARLRLAYSAAEVNLVMAPAGDSPGEVEILDGGLPLDHQSRGADVRETSDGHTVAMVPHPRMYALVARIRYLRARVLELTVRRARLYAFTFGSCA